MVSNFIVNNHWFVPPQLDHQFQPLRQLVQQDTLLIKNN